MRVAYKCVLLLQPPLFDRLSLSLNTGRTEERTLTFAQSPFKHRCSHRLETRALPAQNYPTGHTSNFSWSSGKMEDLHILPGAPRPNSRTSSPTHCLDSGAVTPYLLDELPGLVKHSSPATQPDRHEPAEHAPVAAQSEDPPDHPPEKELSATTEDPYTLFESSQRILIVTLFTVIGFLSPVTGSIYMSALPSVSSDLRVTQEQTQLSVTVFMIFQGLSPLVLGSNTDLIGRRPVLVVSLILFMGADLGIFLLPNATDQSKGRVYAGLMVLRALQASGSASTLSIGSGGIQDVTEPANRGGVMGVFGSGVSMGPALAPVLGAALTSAWGWRSIFIFLFVLASVLMIVLLLFLPEYVHYCRKLRGWKN